MNKCITCKSAEWQMTKHKPPRINKAKHGRCRFIVEPFLMPSIINANDIERLIGRTYRRYIWAGSTNNECRCWELKK